MMKRFKTHKPVQPFRHMLNLIPLIVMLSISLFFSGCGNERVEGATPNNQPMSVPMMELALKPFVDSADFMAQVDSKHATDIHPQVSGRLLRVLVEDGQSVHAGQPLFQLDASQQQALVSSLDATRRSTQLAPNVLLRSIDSQKAELAGIQAQLVFNRKQLERYQQLQQDHTVSAKDAEQYETTVVELENRYKTMKSNIGAKEAELKQSYANISRDNASFSSAQANLSYYTIKAPFSGRIGTLIAKVGDMVGPETSLTSLTDSLNLEIEVAIPADYRSKLKLGTSMALYSIQDEHLATAKISYIEPKVDPNSQTFLVKAKIVNGNDLLAMAQRLKARLIWGQTETIKIPIEAVFRQAGQPFVYIAERSPKGLVAKLKPIQLGPIDDQNVVVQSGLKAGDQLITGNIQKLQDNVPVVRLAKE